MSRPHAPLPYDCDRCGGSTDGANLSVTVDLCLDCYELRLADERERAEAAYERRAYIADCQHDAARDERDEERAA